MRGCEYGESRIRARRAKVETVVVDCKRREREIFADQFPFVIRKTSRSENSPP
jgi:hypothetical protein